MTSGKPAQTDAQNRRQSLLAFATYAFVSFLFLARGTLPNFGSVYIGRGTDPTMFMWFLRWWQYVFHHRVNPFVTDLLWAPQGFNLAWSTCIPLPALVAMPLLRPAGEIGAYNVLCLIAPALAALSAYLLCRKAGGGWWPSILGGYIFGFSPYLLGGTLGGHINLICDFPVPLVALIAMRYLDREISATRFTLYLASLLVIEFLCSVELFATLTMVSGFSLILAFVTFRYDGRARLIQLIGPAAVGYLIALAVVSPYLYYMLALQFPHAHIWRPEDYSADVLGFLVPSDSVWLGTSRAAIAFAQKLPGRTYENGAYLGLPLVLMVELFRRDYWHTTWGKLLILIFASLLIAAIGPTLHIAGKPGIPMPWAIVDRLPLISIALPIRFMMYAFLVVAIMVAVWLTESTTGLATKSILGALILISIAPNPSASFWTTPLSLPGFFADRVYQRELSPREIILPVPFGASGNLMYWQAASNMYFRMAGAWTGTVPFEFMRMPLANYFDGSIDLPEAGDQLKAYIARFGVRCVVADLADPNFPIWLPMLDSLAIAPDKQAGVWVYQIPPNAFFAYRNLSSTIVEARANALRFDAILESTGKYLDAGHKLTKVSPLELSHLNLLPRDWRIDTSPHAFFDWGIGATGPDEIGIAIVGSYEGVKPLIERYKAVASQILYPAPTRWTPDAPQRADAMSTLLLVFDRAHLVEAARKLISSPPIERTTSFLEEVPVEQPPGIRAQRDAWSSPIARWSRPRRAIASAASFE